MKRSEFFAEWSRIHGGAEIKGIVKAWLIVSYALTRPLVRLRITPNLLTIASIAIGGLFLWTIDSNFAIALLALSLALDGIDGTLAITSGRVTKFGAALDAVADRIVEALWAYGLFLIGGPWQLVMLAWLASFIQEYMRARSGGLGIKELLIVTPAERPVRATFIFIALVARAVDLDLVLILTMCWALLQSYSALRLFILLRSQLQQSRR